MLALLAIMGIVGAGLVADSLTRPAESPDDAEDAPPEDEGDSRSGSILDMEDEVPFGAGRDWLDGGNGDDSLFGQNGDDVLAAGAGDDLPGIGPGDRATGGDGSDPFKLQDFGPGLPVSEITDYNPRQDQILLLYDASLHSDPVLSAEPVEGSEDVTLLLDGVAVALIRNTPDLDLSQITLRAA